MARKLLPMAVSNVPALIDRTYRESHPYQWVREALINSKEAGATEIRFGLEWQGVENLGVYRRIILDNGVGIPYDKMSVFLNTYGGSGKPIGGEHENFGHGFKTSTLPWNKNGIVVVSKSKDDGSVAMVRLEYDIKEHMYGARIENVDGVRDSVYSPYEAIDTDGIDYSLLIPADWNSGTAIVLLGSPQQPDTVLGAYDREESDLNGIARYLNTRMWDFDDLTVTVDCLSNSNRKHWPKSYSDRGKAESKKWQTRNVRGAKYYVEFERRNGDSQVEASGTSLIAGGLATVHWFLRNGLPTDGTSVANFKGYIGHLYKNEIYTPLNHPSSFRSFGIPGWLKDNVFIIVEPKEFDGNAGAYPNDARTQLLLGGKDAGRTLPLVEWAHEFANKLPEPIAKKVSEHFTSVGTIRDEKWKTRLEERFGFLWKIIKPVMSTTGEVKIRPVQPVRSREETRNDDKPLGPLFKRHDAAAPAKSRTGQAAEDGDTAAADRHVNGGLPDYHILGQDEFDDPWVLASWETPTPSNDNRGRVLINRDHLVLKKHIAETQRAFIGDEDQIAEEVMNVYGELAVAHVAHSERMKGALMSERDVEDKLRSQEALTMALLGVWQIDNILLPRLSGKLSKRKVA